MHVRELVEVAGVVATSGPLIVEGAGPISQAHLGQYWAASRSRFDRWNQALKQLADEDTEFSELNTDHWVGLRSTLDEIFASEILTRLWTAIVVARERRTGTGNSEPVVRNIFDAHMEARRRALDVLLNAGCFSTRQPSAANRLRLRAERWSDMLLGSLLSDNDYLHEFAVNPERAADFALDLAQRQLQPGGGQAWRLLLVSLRLSFAGGMAPEPANPEANARLTSALLGCFPGELFDSTGLLSSLWMMRLSATASDAQGLIEDLLGTAAGGEIAPFRGKSRIRGS
ncbi:MAG: hypothetical protein DWQ37_09020 [Planctomycetota bacterium]|nr:MAG: hypothetical protein DWQ37_09020 [Planctomycetota bacterium]